MHAKDYSSMDKETTGLSYVQSQDTGLDSTVFRMECSSSSRMLA